VATRGKAGRKRTHKQAALKSLCWSLSFKPWLSHTKLQKAHIRIQRLRRQIRQGFVVTEEQEMIAYQRFAEALSRLEDLTGRFFQTFLRYTSELSLHSGYRFPPFIAASQNSVSCSLHFQRTSYCQKTKVD
jgi:hypothetical protein